MHTEVPRKGLHAFPGGSAGTASPFGELGVSFVVAPPLGLHPLMLGVIDERVREGLGTRR